MATTYTWLIAKFECAPLLDGKQDVVTKIHWQRQASSGSAATPWIYGAQEIAFDPKAPFTPYANLTPEQAINWVETSLGPDALAEQKAILDQQIASLVNPPVISPPLPW